MPPVLILQLNRTKFDSKTGQMEKMLHKVPVMEKIYPQRFLLKHREVVEQSRAKVKILRNKLKLLTENLQMYKRYDGKDIELVQLLGSINHFISSQNLNHPQFVEMAQNA